MAIRISARGTRGARIPTRGLLAKLFKLIGKRHIPHLPPLRRKAAELADGVPRRPAHHTGQAPRGSAERMRCICATSPR
jgi:hypothetical protein